MRLLSLTLACLITVSTAVPADKREVRIKHVDGPTVSTAASVAKRHVGDHYHYDLPSGGHVSWEVKHKQRRGARVHAFNKQDFHDMAQDLANEVPGAKEHGYIKISGHYHRLHAHFHLTDHAEFQFFDNRDWNYMFYHLASIAIEEGKPQQMTLDLHYNGQVDGFFDFVLEKQG